MSRRNSSSLTLEEGSSKEEMNQLRKSCCQRGGSGYLLGMQMLGRTASSSFSPYVATNNHVYQSNRNLAEVVRGRGRPRKNPPAAPSDNSNVDQSLIINNKVETVKAEVHEVVESVTPAAPSGAADLWAWIPPRDKLEQHTLQQTYQLPVNKGELQTPEEVKMYLESNGAMDVIVLPLKGGLDNIKHFVIASATSTRLIRQFATTIVENLKLRELHQVMGSQGVEGARNDDWQLVDCHHFLVHLMLPETRKAIDLEGHWSMEERPFVPYCRTEDEYEYHFSKLLEKYPAPKGFSITVSEDDEKEEPVHRPVRIL